MTLWRHAILTFFDPPPLIVTPLITKALVLLSQNTLLLPPLGRDVIYGRSLILDQNKRKTFKKIRIQLLRIARICRHSLRGRR
jgi:hypothetical protein